MSKLIVLKKFRAVELFIVNCLFASILTNIFGINCAFANPRRPELNDFELASIRRSSTSQELASVIHSVSHLRKMRLQCVSQLQGRRVPAQCFEVLTIEGKTGLLDPELGESHKEWLANICLERAQQSRDWQELSTTQGAKFIPESCRKKASQRLADLQYEAKSESPAKLFEFRLSKQAKKFGPKFE